MAAITWTGAAGDGNFNNPANWSPAQVPGATDAVTISPSAVTLININTADAVQALKLSSKVTLSINDNQSLTVGNAATKNASLSNAGTIELNNFNYTTSLVIGGPEVTLSGSGTILMGTGNGNIIVGAASSDVLNNTGNLIEGAGSLGGGSLTYINGAGAVVNANDGNYLYLNTGTNTVTNAGLLETTAGGGLVIQSNVDNGASGRISALGANIGLHNGAFISGGTLTSAGGFAIHTNDSNGLDGTTNAVTNLGTVIVNDNTGLTLLGTIVNNGEIALERNNYNSVLGIGPGGTKPGTVTLSGNGTILLGDSGSTNIITGTIAGDTLINMGNLIEGAGQIGGGTLSLINDATINANGGNALYLNTGATSINNGLIEATGPGGLIIQAGVNSSGGGTILAKGANVFLNGGTLAGGLVTSTGTGSVYVQGSGTLDGTAQTVTNTGTIFVEDNSALNLLGTITNAGTISLNAYNYNSDLLVAGATVTLTGGGTIALNTDNANLITATAAGNELINVNDTIEGAARLGVGSLTFINGAAGIVDANNGGQMILNTGAVATTNMGLLEATAGSAGLVIQSAVNSSGGGTILASNANVILQGGTLAGGVVTSAGTGAVHVQFGSSGTLDGSAQTVTNTGQIFVEDNSALSLRGTITNDSTISLNAYNYYSDILAAGATVTLTGGGTILLNTDSANLITASAAGNALINVNNTIEGAAQLGAGTLTFTNGAAGTVDANNGGQLILNTGTIATTNMGLLEASAGSGGLVIQTNVNNGKSGRISAAGGNVYLGSGADIIGGTLSSSGTGSILDSNNATLGTIGGTITNTGTVVVQDNTTLTLLGTILNKGVVAINSYNYNTDLIIGSTTVAGTTTLSGGGTVSLDQYSGNRIYAGFAGNTLLNLNNMITGAGQIGVGAGANALLVTNDGTIAASTGSALTINTGALLTNNALIEATGGSTLYIDGVINSSGGGTILAASGNVALNGATLEGGLINSAAGFGVYDINSATLDGSTYTTTNAGLVSLNDGTTLTLLGTITNTGTIALNNYNYNTDLIIGSPTVTLTGGGTILLGQYTANRIYGAVGTDVLVNVNNTITGAGQLGAGQMILINEAKGIIDASQTGALNLTSALGGTITNAGLIESTNTGGLIVQTVIDSSTGGTILANGGNVYLNNGGALRGGVIDSGVNGGTFDVNGAFTLDGSGQTVTNNTLISVNDGQTLTLLGTVTNHGTIALNNYNYATDIVIGSPTVTLTGAGTIAMDQYTGNRIYGATGTDVLINVNNLIEGSGQIGAGQLSLINQAAGVIDANSSGNLLLETGSTVINAGLIESTSGGGLSIVGAVDSSSGGTILAAGGNVYLSGGTLQGGLIQSTGGGVFVVNGAGTLDGSAHKLTSNALVNINDGQTLTLLGNIANNGTVTFGNYNYYTDLIVGSPTVTLTGTGTIQLSGTGGARFYGATGADVLDNVSNTIEGYGQLGVGQLTLINAGLIEGYGVGGPLTINLGSTGLNTATGTMLAAGGGGLVFQNGTYTNLGLYEATDAGALTFQAGATLTNDVAGTLTGGTYAAIATASGATVSLTGSAVSTLDAAIVLSGTNSTVTFGGTAIDASLSTIGTAGALSVLGGRNFTVVANGGTLTDNGTITLGGGTFSDAELIIGKKGDFSGFGTLAGPVSNSGTIDVIGGKLVLAGAVTGTGTITTGAGGIIEFGGGGTITQPISGTGTLELGGGTFTIADQNVTIANLAVDANTSLVGTGTITSQTVDNGTITANTGTLSLTGPVTGNGTLSANANSVLIVGGASMFGGTIAGPGTVDLIGPTTLLAGIALKAAAIMQSSTVTLASGVSVTNLAGNTYSLTKNVPGGDLTPHRAQVQIDGGQGNVFTNAGSLLADTNALISVGFVNTGSVADSNGTLTVSGALGGSGSFALAHRAQLDLTGGGTYSGAISGAGALRLDSAVTLNAGASLGVANITDTSLLTLGTGESVKIGAGNIFALADAGGNAPHRAQVAVQGGSGSTFTNVGTVTASALADSFNLKFVNNGLTMVTAGTLSFLGVVSNGGDFAAAGGSVSFAKNVTGTGGLDISAASTFSLLAGAGVGQTANFLATSGALDLGSPLAFAGTIAGFAGSDVIDLLKTASTSETFAAGVLTVQDNGATVASLHFTGSYSTGDFMLQSDGNGGTNITFI